jgi:hypothetical protein
MVNPQNQTLIEGESNIARYIQRLLNPDFDRCVVASTKIDEWLKKMWFKLQEKHTTKIFLPY